MNTSQQKQIERRAKKDARLWAEEFPGEILEGNWPDWDGEAFLYLPDRLQEAPGAWELYSDILNAEIGRLAKKGQKMSAATSDVLRRAPKGSIGVRLSIRMSQELGERLETAARAEGITVTEFVRQAIEAALPLEKKR